MVEIQTEEVRRSSIVSGLYNNEPNAPGTAQYGSVRNARRL